MPKLSDEAIKTFLTYPSLNIRDMAWELLAAREVIRATGPVLQRFEAYVGDLEEAGFLEEQAGEVREFGVTLKTALIKYAERIQKP